MSLLASSGGYAPERMPIFGPTFTSINAVTGEAMAPMVPSGQSYSATGVSMKTGEPVTAAPRRSTPLPPVETCESAPRRSTPIGLPEPSMSDPDPLPETIAQGTAEPDYITVGVMGYEIDRTYLLIGGVVGLAAAFYFMRK